MHQNVMTTHANCIDFFYTGYYKKIVEDFKSICRVSDFDVYHVKKVYEIM